jgi:diadenosine tetraphosphatase ApaH/serine/threonine PP2A family protein phosphatase
MKYAIISDIHANLEALQAVLADARPAAERFICLGDIVGYNANPSECLQIIQSLCEVVIAGNHDQATVGVRPYDDFNEHALAAIDWTRERLSPEEQAYLRGLPVTAPFGTGWLAAHGSPRDTDEYLFQHSHFRDSFIYLQACLPMVRGCFVGHTHVPMVWQCTPAGQTSALQPASLTVQLDPDCRYIINPGSVGQPRYGGPEATYVLFDEAALTVEFRLVPYDVDTTQEKIYDAGLPPYLAERLAIGH